MSLQSEILTGLDVAGWDDSIGVVKQLVGNALRRLDRGVEIKDTGYFNHSFVPDYVLAWPREPARTRDVYLRLDATMPFIQRDLLLLGRSAPLLVGLTGEWAGATHDRTSIARSTDIDTRALVTEPGAVEQLGASAKAVEFGQVLPAAVLKGGRGWVNEPVASDMAGAASTFFSGATTHDPDVVERAAPDVTAHLDVPQTARILNFGRIVWEATGGEPSRYPVRTELSGLDDDALRFLLEEGPPEDPAFWRSVGRLIELDRLLGVGVRGGANLAALVRSNADRLYARALLVKARQRTLDDGDPEWAIESGALVLQGTDFAAYLPPRRDDLAVQPDQARALDLATFRRRTADEQVETVTVVAGDGKRVTIESEDIFDPSTDAVLASVGDLPGTAIASVGLIVGGKHLACDFITRSASGYTNARFDVVSFLERALPMVWPLTDARDVLEVRRVRETVSSVALPPTLFDAVNDTPDTA